MSVKRRMYCEAFFGETMADEQVQPEQYEEIAGILVPQIWTLIQDDGFTPPIELSLTDADGHVVVWMQMDACGKFRSLLDTNPLLPLRGQFPVSVSVTDNRGNHWSASFNAPDLPR